MNQQEEKGSQDAEESLNESVNTEDFPEAEDSPEQPFKKVPTMDA